MCVFAGLFGLIHGCALGFYGTFSAFVCIQWYCVDIA
jgi:hypothetical protein